MRAGAQGGHHVQSSKASSHNSACLSVSAWGALAFQETWGQRSDGLAASPARALPPRCVLQ